MDKNKKYTRYEKARIIGARALQISRGAPLMLKADSKEPINIAKAEWDKGLIPIDVVRPDDTGKKNS